MFEWCQASSRSKWSSGESSFQVFKPLSSTLLLVVGQWSSSTPLELTKVPRYRNSESQPVVVVLLAPIFGGNNLFLLLDHQVLSSVNSRVCRRKSEGRQRSQWEPQMSRQWLRVCGRCLWWSGNGVERERRYWQARRQRWLGRDGGGGKIIRLQVWGRTNCRDTIWTQYLCSTTKLKEKGKVWSYYLLMIHWYRYMRLYRGDTFLYGNTIDEKYMKIKSGKSWE